MSPGDIEIALANVTAGLSFDWSGGEIPAPMLATMLKAAAFNEKGAVPISIENAVIKGDLILDLLEANSGQLRLQLLGCQIEGDFRARHSKWAQLTLVGCQVRQIDLFHISVSSDLVVEEVQATLLNASLSEIGGRLVLRGTNLTAGEDEYGLELDEARVGRRFDATGATIIGGIHAPGIVINGDAIFDCAHVIDRDNFRKAIEMSNARIIGQVRCCSDDERRFETRGRFQLDNAEIGGLIIRGARLDGAGLPALLCQNSDIRGTVNLSGYRNDGVRFESHGSVLLASTKVERQVEIYDAEFLAERNALAFYGAEVAGDVTIGMTGVATSINGGLNIEGCRVRSLIINDLEARGPDFSISARRARFEGAVALHSSTFHGPILLDKAHADSIFLAAVTVTRAAGPTDLSQMPENYAHPADSLIDLNESKVGGEVSFESVTLEGGCCRLIEARIEAGIQFSNLSVAGAGEMAIIGQNAVIGGDVMFASKRGEGRTILGKVHFLGAKIAGGWTMSDIDIGAEGTRSDIILRNAKIEGDVTLRQTVQWGEFNAGGATIGGDLAFHSSIQKNVGDPACDIRGIQVAGKLSWATATRAEPVAAEIGGHVYAPGASIGVLAWSRVRLTQGSTLNFSNLSVARSIDAGPLIGAADTGLSLAGTSVPLLIDLIDDEEDSWGAAATNLDLNNFNYTALANPSGGNGDTPSAIIKWRRTWLDRKVGESTRPWRHLAAVLREQGLFEASRQALIHTFSLEGAARPTKAGRLLSRGFGLCFGHGLSWTRTLASLVVLWAVGILGVICVQNSNLLVMTGENGQAGTKACEAQIDPSLYAADVMLPLVDLGQETKCQVGRAKGSTPFKGYAVGQSYFLFGEIDIARFLASLYAVAGWLVVSLSIATWSGLFRRSGRD